ETINCSVEIIKRSELHKFVVLPKRWIVERTFAWLENYRRLWQNCERTLENSRQSCLLAAVAILLKRSWRDRFLRKLEVPRMDSERSEVYFSTDSVLVWG
ncbi:hypothetical protein IAY_05758, partial [Bacillus cereus TIAC219]